LTKPYTPSPAASDDSKASRTHSRNPPIPTLASLKSDLATITTNNDIPGHSRDAGAPLASEQQPEGSGGDGEDGGQIVSGISGGTPQQLASAIVILAGTTARTIAQCAIHPVETLKTRIMLRRALRHGAATATTHLGAMSRRLPVLAGAGGGLRGAGASLMLRPNTSAGAQDLLHGLHAGLAGALLAAVPTGLCYFYTYELCCTHLRLYLEPCAAGATAHTDTRSQNHGSADSASSSTSGKPRSVTGPVHLISAATAAAVSSVTRVPADVVRHRVQAGLDPSLMAAARSAWQRGGIGGLYAGWAATLVRDIPEIVLSFTLFEIGRHTWCGMASGDAAGAGGDKSSGLVKGGRKLKPGDSSCALEPWQHLVLGGACGGFAAAVTVPLDNIKARVQCGLTAGGSGAAAGLSGVRMAAVSILKEGGPAGFVAGMVPRVVQVRACVKQGYGLMSVGFKAIDRLE